MVNRAFTLKRIVSPGIPYITVGVGLLFIQNVWVAIFSYHIGMLLILMISKPGIPITQLFKTSNYRIPVMTATIGVMGGALLYLLWPWLSVPKDINTYARSIGLTEETWLLFLAYFALVNPLIEEYYWRGYLGSSSKHIEFNDLLFSGYHLIVIAGKMGMVWLAIVFFIVTIGAWFWRQVNRLSRGLLPSTVSHFAGDISVMVIIYMMLR